MKSSSESESTPRPSLKLLGDCYYDTEESIRELLDELSDATKGQYSPTAVSCLSSIVTELMFDGEVSVKSLKAGEEFIEIWRKRIE